MPDWLRLLDLESEASGSVLTGGNFLSLDLFCFHIVKLLMPILSLLPMLCVCENLERVSMNLIVGYLSKYNRTRPSTHWLLIDCLFRVHQS